MEGFEVIKVLFLKIIILIVDIWANYIQIETYFNVFSFNFEFSLPCAAISNWSQTNMIERIFYKRILVKSVYETKKKQIEITTV